MSEINDNLDAIALAMRTFFQTMKRPGTWAHVMQAAGLDIDRPAATILYVLNERRYENIGVQALATQLGIEAPSVTRKTQALEAAGLIQRIRSDTDQRAVYLQVTPEGVQATKKLWAAQREYMRQALQTWSPKDREAFQSLLERFSADLQAVHEADNPTRT